MSIKLRYRGDWRVDVRKDFILDPTLSIGAKVIYIALRAHCAPDADTAFPSALYLAKCLSVSRDTVHKYVAELRDKGWVETEQRGEGGKFTHTFYTVNDRSGKNPLRTNAVAENPDTKTPQREEELTVKKEDAAPTAAAQRKERHQQFIQEWAQAFADHFEDRYRVTGRDGKATKHLVTESADIEELVWTARTAWKMTGPKFWNCTRAITIHFFAEHLNEVRAELRTAGHRREDETKERKF